jgi:ABC-type antimicrobial peptide transport system permease subunit
MPAKLAMFFGVVALLLAGVGLYGVLDYSVLRQRKEIGIRTAIGAHASGVVRHVTGDVLSMVLMGALAGLGFGMASVRYIQALLYQVRPTNPGMLAFPALTILVAAFLAALPAVNRAVRIARPRRCATNRRSRVATAGRVDPTTLQRSG